MPETKYGKYIITERKLENEAPWTPNSTREEVTPMMFLDSNLIPGSFYVETAWHLKPFATRIRGTPHKHDYDEVLAFYGSDPEDPHNLFGRLEVHLGDEVHVVTKSCLIFIPKGLMHGPIIFDKMEKPIFHFSCGTGGKYF